MSDATARPATIRTQVQVHPVSIWIRPHLWYTWAMIAVREEQRAWRLRRAGLQQADFAEFLAQEAHEAMQSVVAARHALHNLFRVWQPMLGLSGESKVRPHHFTVASLPPAWDRRVLQLIDDRDGVVHHDEEMAAAQPHSQYPVSVSALEASFNAERATGAVDVMLNDVLRPAIVAPSTALQQWSADVGHVPVALDDLRTPGHDALL